jgi:hypothetical protein
MVGDVRPEDGGGVHFAGDQVAADDVWVGPVPPTHVADTPERFGDIALRR